MATQKQDGLFTDCAKGASDLTDKENLFCLRNSSGLLELTDADERIDGVISEGKVATLHSSFNTGGGWLKVIAESAIAIGDRVQSGALGKAKTGSTNSFGIARNAVAAGEYVEVVPDRT